MVIRDITRVLSAEFPAWPGDPPFALERVASIARGDPFEVSRLTMSVHAASHLDAPSHCLEGGGDLGTLPLDLLIGTVRVVRAPVNRPVTLADLEGGGASDFFAGDDARTPLRLLVRTESAETMHGPASAFATLSGEAAERLARGGVRLFGIDTPSVDPPGAASPQAHLAFARAGGAILEWLDLRDVAPGEYFLIALPLRLRGAEASPVRALLLESAPDLEAAHPASPVRGAR